MRTALPPLELLPRDLSAYRAGNVGIDHVHRFESGQPGPHMLVNALTHGNEFCGMVAEADHILDLHSTSQDVEPFWVYPDFARNARVASALAAPAVHLVMPSGLGSGTPVIQHGRHGLAESNAGAALVAECGQHFKRSSGDLAVEVTLDFLAHFGLIARTPRAPATLPRRFELLRTHVVAHADFRFTRPVVGFETFAQGELIAMDGPEAIHAPCDDCTLFMPTREPIVGREGVYLTRPIRD